jgi:hypothetical protein
VHDDLDALLSEKFLDSLDTNSKGNHLKKVEKPAWVLEENHTTHRAWHAISALKAEKEINIRTLGKVADSKTPKSIYEIKKTEVAEIVGLTAQSIFRASSFSSDVLDFFNVVNIELLKLHKKEQHKQILRNKKTGTRINKKEDLVNEVQVLRKKVRELECQNAKDTLDLALTKMPFDLRQRLKM